MSCAPGLEIGFLSVSVGVCGTYRFSSMRPQLTSLDDGMEPTTYDAWENGKHRSNRAPQNDFRVTC